MPKVRLQKELMNIKRESEAAFQIREEFVRWDNVKTAHDLMDDMEVARMLLDCYDLVGGNFLIWSDQAKLAPPPLYATLRLQHVTSEGFEVLQEIKALGAWKRDTAELSQRKSKRKQTHVRRIAQVQVKKEVETDDDEDFISDDDDDYMPEDEIIPQRVIKSPRSARGRKAKKPVASSTRALEAPESGNNDGGHGTSSKPAARKRGRPRKGEVRPPPPKRGRKRKPKPEEEMYEDTKTSEIDTQTTQTDNDDPKTSKRKRTRRKTGNSPVSKRKTNTLFQCKKCETILESFKEFRSHYQTHLKSAETESRTPVVRSNKQLYTLFYRCKSCASNEIYDEKGMIRHRHGHVDRVNEVCDTCGKVFTRRSSWNLHRRKHEANKTGRMQICKLCGKTFPLIKYLKKHMQFHSKERPYTCEICGKSFKERNALLKHGKTHSNTRPFECQYCGKGFIQPYRLKEHMRTHTGEKPFKCDVCYSAFGVKQALKVHKKAVHGIDMSLYQKSQTFQEFDEIDPRDPKMFENCTVKVTSRSEDLTNENKEQSQMATMPLVISLEEGVSGDADKPPIPLALAHDEAEDPNSPGTNGEGRDALRSTNNMRILYSTTGNSLTSPVLQNPHHKASSETAGMFYLNL